jgi:hypothetical protein
MSGLKYSNSVNFKKAFYIKPEILAKLTIEAALAE